LIMISFHIKDIEDAVKDIGYFIDDCQKQYSSVGSIYESVKGRLVELISRSESDISKANSEISQANGVINHNKAVAEKTKKRIKELEAEIKRLEKEKNDTEDDIKKLKTQLALAKMSDDKNKSSTISSINSEISSCESSIKDIKKDIEDDKKEIEELKDKLERIERANDELEQIITQINGDIAKIQAVLSAMQKAKSTLATKKERYDGTYSQTRKMGENAYNRASKAKETAWSIIASFNRMGFATGDSFSVNCANDIYMLSNEFDSISKHLKYSGHDAKEDVSVFASRIRDNITRQTADIVKKTCEEIEGYGMEFDTYAGGLMGVYQNAAYYESLKI